MPKFHVEALEKLYVKTQYRDVEANSAKEAEALVRTGKVAYDAHSIEEGDEEIVAILNVDQIESTSTPIADLANLHAELADPKLLADYLDGRDAEDDD